MPERMGGSADRRMPRAGTPVRQHERMSCPVCLGVKMEKLRIGPGLELDACPRCGGMFFDAGEVPALRRLRPQALWAHVEARPDDFRMKCHECLATLKRNDGRCPACGRENVLHCPRCSRAMNRVSHDNLVLDVCRRCRGVWFDNTELAQIWNMKVTAMERRAGDSAPVSDDSLVLHALIWTDPTVMYLGAHAAANVAPLAAAAVENTGELAGSVLDAIGGVIQSVFETLGDLF